MSNNVRPILIMEYSNQGVLRVILIHPEQPSTPLHVPLDQQNPQLTTTLSPILRSPTRIQRPAPLSGIFLIKPPSPWTPTKTPPRILGHHNTNIYPRQDTQTHTHTRHTLTIHDRRGHTDTIHLRTDQIHTQFE